MPDKHLLRCFICWILFKCTEGACTFPSEFQDTKWYDSNKGTITFNTSMLSGWTLTALGTILSTWNCLSTNYYSSGYLLMSGTNSFTYSKVSYYSYLCLKLTKITEYSYYYVRVNAEQPNIYNERVYVSTASNETSFSKICDVGNIEPSSQFHVLIKNGSNISDTKQICPTASLGNFDYVYNDSKTMTLSCNSSSDQWVVCNDRRSMTFNYSTCNQTMAYSQGGFVWCVHSVVGTYTYLVVFNNDTTSVIDNTNYYRFTCFVMSDNSASMVYGSCKKGQTPYTYAQDDVTGNKIGALLTLTPYVTCPIINSKASKDSQIGAIVGGVIGGIVVIALIAIILIFLYKKNRLCFGKPSYTVMEKTGNSLADTEEEMEIIREKNEKESKFEKYEETMKSEKYEENMTSETNEGKMKSEQYEEKMKSERSAEERAEKHQMQRVEKVESVSHGDKLLNILENDRYIHLPSDREKVQTILNTKENQEEKEPKLEKAGNVLFKALRRKPKPVSKKKKKKTKIVIKRLATRPVKASSIDLDSHDMDFQDVEEISCNGSNDLEGSDEELKALQRESTVESITYKTPIIEKVSNGNIDDKTGINSKWDVNIFKDQQKNSLKVSEKPIIKRRSKLKRSGSVSSRTSLLSIKSIQKAGKGKKNGLKVAWAKDLEKAMDVNGLENSESLEKEVIVDDNVNAVNVEDADIQEIQNLESISESAAFSWTKRKRRLKSGSVTPSTGHIPKNIISKRKKKTISKSRYIKSSKLKGKGSINLTPDDINSGEVSKVHEHKNKVTFEDENILAPSEPFTQIEKENSKLNATFLELLLNDTDVQESRYSAGLSLAERESKMIDEGYITPSLVEREVTLSRAPTSTSMKGSPALSLGERQPTIIRLSSAKTRNTETEIPSHYTDSTVLKQERSLGETADK